MNPLLRPVPLLLVVFVLAGFVLLTASGTSQRLEALRALVVSLIVSELAALAMKQLVDQPRPLAVMPGLDRLKTASRRGRLRRRSGTVRRERLGLSTVQLARRAGIDRVTLWAVETGARAVGRRPASAEVGSMLVAGHTCGDRRCQIPTQTSRRSRERGEAAFASQLSFPSQNARATAR